MPDKTSSTLRAAVIAVVTLVGLLLLVVVLREDTDNGAGGELEGGFHALSEEEFADAIQDAQREAGSWSYEEVETLDGQVKSTWVGEQTWDGTTTTLHYGTKDTDGAYLIEVLVVDAAIYLKDTTAREGTPAGRKPWLKLDAEESSQSGVLVDSILKEADPARRASVFAEPSTFELVGIENIGTDVAAHYRVGVPVEAVRDASGLPVPGEPGEQQVFDVYLDKDDRLVKLVIPTSLGTIESVETRTFSHYGEDFEIVAPPADQVRSGRPILAE